MRSPMISDAEADELEETFYAALRAGDLERLMACWADDEEVVCVHPGGVRLVGLRAVRDSFRELLAQGGVRMQVQEVQRVHAPGCCIHSVVERLEVMTGEGLRHGYLLATNVYAKTEAGWRLFTHHSSPADAEAMAELTGQSHTLH